MTSKTSSKKPDPAKAPAKKRATKKPVDSGAGATGSKQAFEQKVEANLAQSLKSFASIQARASDALEDGKSELREQFQRAEKQIEANLATTKRRLHKLKDAGEDSWEDLHEGVESAWADLSQSLKKIMSRFD